MENKLNGAMGMAMRAGQCIAGDFACEKKIRSGKAKLIMLDARASENTKDRYTHISCRFGVDCVIIEGMAEAIGKYGHMIAVITDESFARMINRAYEELTQDVK